MVLMISWCWETKHGNTVNDDYAFNGDISGWDVSSVNDMSYMFMDSAFSGDISGWDVSSVNDMAGMFWRDYFISTLEYDYAFNGDISEWDVSSVTRMYSMFKNSSFSGDISEWDVSSVILMYYMFAHSDFNGNLGNWYITLDNTSIAGIPGTVGNIVAQNGFLVAQKPIYGIGSGDDSEYFDINGTELILMATPDDSLVTVNITSTTSSNILNIGFSATNSRIFEITFTPIPP